MRKCRKPAHLNKKEQNDGIVGMLEASFHIEQTTPRLSVSSPKDRWRIFKSWNQTNQTRWYNRCWFASGTGFCVPSHWTILLHAKPLCGQPCRGQLLSVFSQWNQTKSNQSGPKSQEARTWVLFKDPWAAWVAWVARIIYIVCEITVQHGWTTWIAWNVSKTS